MNIVVADSHTICREALCEFIRHSNSGYTVSSVADYESFLQAIDQDKPDFLLFDPELPGLAEACDALMFFQKNPALKVGVLLTDTKADNTLYASYVHGYFPKTIPSKEFVEGIGKVLKGQEFVPSHIDHDAMMPRFKQSIDELNLTTREKEVLSYLMKGAANKDIARALDLQVVTIKLHVRGICRKMNVKNRTQAALVAMENGWE